MAPPVIDPLVRFARWVRWNKSGCLEWTGGKTHDGYGRFWFNNGRAPAHRFLYEQLVQPIPETLTLDHLCRNTSCVNPNHLEPVTIKENIRRGYSYTGKNARKTHCPKEHLLAGNNVLQYRGKRVCLACRELYNKRRQDTRQRRKQSLSQTTS